MVGGRSTYDAAEHWGDQNPWDLPLFIVIHRPDEGTVPAVGFRFVEGVEKAIAEAKAAAGDKDVHVMGGGEVIRQALAARLVDEVSIIVAPLILGGGSAFLRGLTS